MKEYSSLQAEYKLIWTHNPKETWVPEKSIYSRIMSVVKLTTPPPILPQPLCTEHRQPTIGFKSVVIVVVLLVVFV